MATNTNTQLFNNTSATEKQHHTQQQAQKRGRKPRTWSPEVEQELAQAKWAIESRGDQPTASRLLAEFRKPGYPNAYAANFSKAQIQNKLSRENLRTKRNRPEGSSSEEESGTGQPQLKRGKHEGSTISTAATSPPNDADTPLLPAATKLELAPPPPTALKLVVTTRGQDDESRHAIAQTFLQEPQAALRKTVRALVNLQEQLKAQAQTFEDEATREVDQVKEEARAEEIRHKHELEELKRENQAQAQAVQKLQAERDQLRGEVEKTKRINADLVRSQQSTLQAANKVVAERDQLKGDNERLQKDLKAATASNDDWLAAIKPALEQFAKSENAHVSNC